MRPIVEPNSPREYGEIIELFRANGIHFHETPSTIWAPVTIWVAEDDCQRAAEIAESVAARHGSLAKQQWDKEWNERYHKSYARWLRDKFRKPGNVLRVILLLLVIGLFAIYPLMNVFKR